ncbi:Tho complex subunit THP2 [Ancylostoma duodenale]|uniref:Tho complex subunit THP2 n=1 Tax=Ancylostoma duodenale TaxID=51022 RepID=A0A0C2D0L4_9BILA|nr:Tho complex subunit THP2 [Ancylostoma duodenale]
MSMHIKTQKRLLTTYGNKLEQNVNKLRQEQPEVIAAEMATPREINEGIYRLEESINAIESLFFKAEKTLNDYATSIDRLQSPSEKEQEEFDEYSCRAESILSTAFDYVILLKARRSALTCANVDPNRSLLNPSQPQAQLQSKSLELPTLPIPTFSGNLWEWDNFWELFNNNIHSQDLPVLFKFNYLLSALKGEARASIKKFQVTKENYPRVIQFLVSKYDNREVLINQLIDRLDACKMRSTSAKDQRALLEQVQALTTQLAQKGEHIDSPWLIKKVLSKFPDSVKRKVISKRQNLPTETSSSIQILFRFLDEILSSEEMFLFFTDKSTVEQKHSRTMPFHSRPGQGRVISCMYCSNPHSSFSCTKYKTPQERSLYLCQNRLCLICASSKHKTTECKGIQCFNCQGVHHTSCCFRSKQKTDSSPFQRRDTSMRATPATTTPPKQQDSHSKVSAKKPSPTLHSHTVINTGSSSGDVPTQETQCVLNTQTMGCPYLPAGKVTIRNPNTKELMQVDVLIDTGAEISFIDNALAECLHLPVIEEKQIRLHTFGSKEIQTRKCRLVKMNIWDSEGKQHVLKLLTHDVLTQAFKPPKVSNTDIDFLRSLNLSILTHSENALIKA